MSSFEDALRRQSEDRRRQADSDAHHAEIAAKAADELARLLWELARYLYSKQVPMRSVRLWHDIKRSTWSPFSEPGGASPHGFILKNVAKMGETGKYKDYFSWHSVQLLLPDGRLLITLTEIPH